MITLKMPHAQSVALGVWACVGARQETKRLNGISHFLEHLLFKGTPTRSAKKISEEIEGVGGEINAHTSEERTCYYATAPAASFRKVSRVLLDLYANPKLAEKDIALERGVIEEEILMYQDEPSQHVHDLLNTIFWKGHALGRPITGTAKSIGRFAREDFVRYRNAFYHRKNTVVSAAGAVDHALLVRLVSEILEPLPPGPKTIKPFLPAPPHGEAELVFEQRTTSQTHVSLGLPGPDVFSPDRHAAGLLQILLGGNSSSRLFQDLRERNGLCYNVATYSQSLLDTGMINVSIGLDGKNLPECFRILARHFHALRSSPCRESELRRAKEYVLGSSSMSLERTGSQNSRIAQSLMVHGKVLDLREWRERILSVSPQDICLAAQKYLDPSRAKIAIIGPPLPVPDLLPLLAG